MSITETRAWANLQDAANNFDSFTLREAFASNAKRSSEFTYQACDLNIDLSRHLWNADIREFLNGLANERCVPQGIASMFAGQRINVTENRSVLHTALRQPRGATVEVDGLNVVPQVHAVLDAMEIFARRVRAGELKGSNGSAIKTIVNIGIGGSDLGPVMAYEALKAYATRALDFHFVSNVDGADITEVLKKCDADSTLFIVASKTFTTSETMTNAATAREWLQLHLGDTFDSSKHFVALSTNATLVADFGIAPENVFGFWDWVGGRFSLDSAIGLSLMIAIGPEAFREMLDGFHAMDMYVQHTPVEQNAVIALAGLSVWYRNFLGFQSYAVLPYDNYLKRLPAYLQQLLMESNGKSVHLDGTPVSVETSPIYWGEPGTNGQHSFHQLLHQGTTPVPVDFLFGANPIAQQGEHHTLLLANVLAQSSVLAFGKTAEEIASEGTPAELVAHKVMPGNRPSSVIIYPMLTPAVLGQIVAMYEHITLVQGLLWGVGSFDQWGVELGKVVANKITPALRGGDATNLDAATQASLNTLRSLQN
jgi:glucose-6-phosphate isomerase